MKTASVGVDVDSLCHYYRIHGLDESGASNAAWEVGVPRFVALFDELGVPATFYCIAEDMAFGGNADRARAVAEAGHEIGNHTWHHRYDLTQLNKAERQAELAEGRRILEEASGSSVIGFRSPGYNTTSALVADVACTGHRYDSSVFPCAPYYLAKAGIMGLMRLRGRRSRSVLGEPRVLSAPRDPYRMRGDDPYRPGAGLWQFPVAVAGGIPLIGTAFTALGRAPSVAAAKAGVRMRQHLTIEFHAVDLLSLDDDGLDPTLAVQPDLKVPVAKKRRIFRDTLAAIARKAEFVRLDSLCWD